MAFHAERIVLLDVLKKTSDGTVVQLERFAALNTDQMMMVVGPLDGEFAAFRCPQIRLAGNAGDDEHAQSPVNGVETDFREDRLDTGVHVLGFEMLFGIQENPDDFPALWRHFVTMLTQAVYDLLQRNWQPPENSNAGMFFVKNIPICSLESRNCSKELF